MRKICLKHYLINDAVYDGNSSPEVAAEKKVEDRMTRLEAIMIGVMRENM